MFSGSIAVFVLVSLFSSGQSTTTVAPQTTVTAIAPTTEVAAAATTIGTPASTTAVLNPTATGAAPKPTSTSAAPTSASATAAPTTESSIKPSCASISFIGNLTWNASFAEKNSDLYKAGEKMVSKAMKYLYNDSAKYEDVKVSDVEFANKDTKMMVKAKLCLVVKGNDLIEDVFKAKVKSGSLHEDFSVLSDSAGFEALGVTFKDDWKAKDGECEKCDGAAGEFEIKRTCEAKTYSCKGQKNTKTTTDCVEYCPSSAVTFTISTLILAIGMFLSFSF